MEIMKNTASTNEALWHIKHLIELRPITFPYGEPTIDDVGHIEVS
jgi:large subunit ribosomal protein L30